jgi:selenocysteine lyase/cysteine desulfurase
MSACYLLDVTQSAGQFPVDVNAIGCDMLTGTGRKFLRGPRGTGFSWARAAALDRLDPFVAEIGSPTWDGHHGFTDSATHTTRPRPLMPATASRSPAC